MMESTLLLKILSICVILQVHGVSGGCVDLDSVTQDGKRMISSVYKMLNSVSLFTCVSHCLTVSKCLSLSYQRKTRTCYLASQDSAGNPGDVHTDPEFFLTNISQWPWSLAGPCEGTTCASGSRCVVDRLHNPSCVSDERKRCGPAPDLANANKSSTGLYEGDVTEYTCLSDFIFCGTSSTHTCSSLGYWEGLSGACETAAWYTPTVLFSEAMPCPMIVGYKVRFEGRPLLHTRVSMIVETTEMLIQADVRLNFGGDQDTFYLHKKEDGVWNTFVGVPSPFAVGEHFTIEIVRQTGKYEIYINGTNLGYAEDSTPDRHPDKITVEGDVQIDKISFLSG